MKAIISFVLLLSAVAFAASPKSDVKGSADHPLLTRFPGSVITSYRQVDYDEYTLPLGKSAQVGVFAKSETLTGKFTSINYVSDDQKSVLEIFENYVQALNTAGFDVMYTCVKEKECGPALGKYMGAAWYADSRYIAVKGGDPAAPAYIAVFVHKQGSANSTGIMVRVVESKAMKTGQVTATAAVIQQGLATQGKFALYGLYFDTGKAELQPASDPALAEVAQVLKGNPSLSLYVVGHTDSAGDVGFNLGLSERRAAAAVKALVDRYGISARRLTPKGVGPFAPVGSNRSEEGRAKNRRVELVEVGGAD